MKCTLIADNFKKALSLIERSTSKDLTLPILGSFLITTETNTVKITGTNLELGMETTIRGTVEKPGKVAIPARALSAYVHTIQKDEKITIESKNSIDVSIYTQTQKTVFKGYPHDDFPPFPYIQDVYKIQIKKADIFHAVSKALISVSKNNIKPELASIYFIIDKDILILASTDSFRLSEERLQPVSFSPKIAKESFLLPVRTCEELLKLCEYGEEQNVLFVIGKGEIQIQYNNTVLYSRLTEGNFPDYGQIIPKKFKTNITLSRSEFINHIKRASIFVNKLQGISLNFLSDSGSCIIESNNKDVGEYAATMKASVEGEDIQVVFNYHYLLDGVEKYTDDTLFFGFNSDTHPLLIRPIKKEDSLYVVMPMKGGI